MNLGKDTRRKSLLAVREIAGKLSKFTSCAVVLDGHSASSISERLGLSGPNLLYRWKSQMIQEGGSMAVGLEGRVRELEAELKRVERERDILKKALSIFGRDD